MPSTRERHLRAHSVRGPCRSVEPLPVDGQRATGAVSAATPTKAREVFRATSTATEGIATMGLYV
jgi:hypothetical protein